METALQTIDKKQIVIPTDIAPTDLIAAISGDLNKLSPDGKLKYYAALCEFTGLNPLALPFEWVVFQGKLRLYAKKDCAEQLRKLHNVSIDPKSTVRRFEHGCYIVEVTATMPSGRVDGAIAAVPFDDKMPAEAKANALMKCDTKAKRRATFSIIGLGMLDRHDDAAPAGSAPTNIASVETAEDRAAALNQLTAPVIDVQSSPASTENHNSGASAPPAVDAEVFPEPVIHSTAPAAAAAPPQAAVAASPVADPAGAPSAFLNADNSLKEDGAVEFDARRDRRGVKEADMLAFLSEKQYLAAGAPLTALKPNVARVFFHESDKFWKQFDRWAAGRAKS